MKDKLRQQPFQWRPPRSNWESSTLSPEDADLRQRWHKTYGRLGRRYETQTPEGPSVAQHNGPWELEYRRLLLRHASLLGGPRGLMRRTIPVYNFQPPPKGGVNTGGQFISVEAFLGRVSGPPPPSWASAAGSSPDGKHLNVADFPDRMSGLPSPSGPHAAVGSSEGQALHETDSTPRRSDIPSQSDPSAAGSSCGSSAGGSGSSAAKEDETSSRYTAAEESKEMEGEAALSRGTGPSALRPAVPNSPFSNPLPGLRVPQLRRPEAEDRPSFEHIEHAESRPAPMEGSQPEDEEKDPRVILAEARVAMGWASELPLDGLGVVFNKMPPPRRPIGKGNYNSSSPMERSQSHMGFPGPASQTGSAMMERPQSQAQAGIPDPNSLEYINMVAESNRRLEELSPYPPETEAPDTPMPDFAELVTKIGDEQAPQPLPLPPSEDGSPAPRISPDQAPIGDRKTRQRKVRFKIDEGKGKAKADKGKGKAVLEPVLEQPEPDDDLEMELNEQQMLEAAIAESKRSKELEDRRRAGQSDEVGESSRLRPSDEVGKAPRLSMSGTHHARILPAKRDSSEISGGCTPCPTKNRQVPVPMGLWTPVATMSVNGQERPISKNELRAICLQPPPSAQKELYKLYSVLVNIVQVAPFEFSVVDPHDFIEVLSWSDSAGAEEADVVKRLRQQSTAELKGQGKKSFIPFTFDADVLLAVVGLDPMTLQVFDPRTHEDQPKVHHHGIDTIPFVWEFIHTLFPELPAMSAWEIHFEGTAQGPLAINEPGIVSGQYIDEFGSKIELRSILPFFFEALRIVGGEDRRRCGSDKALLKRLFALFEGCPGLKTTGTLQRLRRDSGAMLERSLEGHVKAALTKGSEDFKRAVAWVKNGSQGSFSASKVISTRMDGKLLATEAMWRSSEAVEDIMAQYSRLRVILDRAMAKCVMTKSNLHHGLTNKMVSRWYDIPNVRREAWKLQSALYKSRCEGLDTIGRRLQQMNSELDLWLSMIRDHLDFKKMK